MTKFITALFAGVSIFFLGLRESRRLFRRADEADKIYHAADRICSLITFHHSSKTELLAEFHIEGITSLSLASENEILLFLEDSDFPFGDRETHETTKFIHSLAKGTLEEQIRLALSFKEFWLQIKNDTKSAFEKKSRLSITLGSLAGLAVTIILM